MRARAEVPAAETRVSVIVEYHVLSDELAAEAGVPVHELVRRELDETRAFHRWAAARAALMDWHADVPPPPPPVVPVLRGKRKVRIK